MSRSEIVSFFEKCEEMLLSDETARLLATTIAGCKDGTVNPAHNPGKLSVNWQHEIFQSMGIHHDMGVQSLNSMQEKYAQDTNLNQRLQRFQQVRARVTPLSE